MAMPTDKILITAAAGTAAATEASKPTPATSLEALEKQEKELCAKIASLRESLRTVGIKQGAGSPEHLAAQALFQPVNNRLTEVRAEIARLKQASDTKHHYEGLGAAAPGSAEVFVAKGAALLFGAAAKPLAKNIDEKSNAEGEFIIKMRQRFSELRQELNKPQELQVSFKLQKLLAELNKELSEKNLPELRKIFTVRFIENLIKYNLVGKLTFREKSKEDYSSHDVRTLDITLREIENIIDQFLLGQKLISTTAGLIIISAGSGDEGSVEQQKPAYALHATGKTLIINIDKVFSKPFPKGYLEGPLSENVNVCYYATRFGDVKPLGSKDMNLGVDELFEGFNNAVARTNAILEKAIIGNKRFVFQSFFQPHRLPPFIHALAVKYPDRIGKQFEVIVGYTNQFPPLVYSRQFFEHYKDYDETLEIIIKAYKLPDAVGFSPAEVRENPEKYHKKILECGFGILYPSLPQIPFADLFTNKATLAIPPNVQWGNSAAALPPVVDAETAAAAKAKAKK